MAALNLDCCRPCTASLTLSQMRRLRDGGLVLALLLVRGSEEGVTGFCAFRLNES